MRLIDLLVAKAILEVSHRSAEQGTGTIAKLLAQPPRIQRLLPRRSPAYWHEMLIRAHVSRRSDKGCLERAVALAWILKEIGSSIRLVIGVRKRPFASHAWIEIAGQPVAEEPRRLRGLVSIWEWTPNSN